MDKKALALIIIPAIFKKPVFASKICAELLTCSLDNPGIN